MRSASFALFAAHPLLTFLSRLRVARPPCFFVSLWAFIFCPSLACGLRAATALVVLSLNPDHLEASPTFGKPKDFLVHQFAAKAASFKWIVKPSAPASEWWEMPWENLPADHDMSHNQSPVLKWSTQNHASRIKADIRNSFWDRSSSIPGF